MNIEMLENESLVVKVGDASSGTRAVSMSELVSNFDEDIKMKYVFEIYFSIDENGELIDIEILK